jgi:hypothetical protein
MEEILKIATPIVAFGSLVLSLFALLFNRKKWSLELHAPFLERVIDQRMRSYPALWRITSTVYKQTPAVTEEHFSPKWASELLRGISHWYYEEGNGIFMNQDSRNAFLGLHEALWTFKAGEGRDRVKDRVDELRAELRKDLKIEERGAEAMNV